MSKLIIFTAEEHAEACQISDVLYRKQFLFNHFTKTELLGKARSMNVFVPVAGSIYCLKLQIAERVAIAEYLLG